MEEIQKKKKRDFDESQKAAINAMKNSVVSAGAGSGKTTVLSERFTKLVRENHMKCEEILTLTFTKKATVEMSSRIYRTLKESVPEAAADFYRANIKTLDAYCASVAKMGSHYYGIAPDFKQDEELIQAKAVQMAVPFILKHSDQPVIRALAGTRDFTETAVSVFVKPILFNSTVCEPIDFDAGLEMQKAEIKLVWAERCKKIIEAVSNLEAAYKSFEGNSSSSLIASVSDALELEIPEIPFLTDEMIESSDTSVLDAFLEPFRAIAKIKLTGGRMNGADEIKSSIKEIRPLYESFSEITSYVSTYSILSSALPYFKEFQAELNEFKRSSGTLTFSDISSLAYCILRDHPEIRKVEKEKYRAIMIDEFQDNNSLQRDLLFMLAERPEIFQKGVPTVDMLCPDKLFFVGDEKQSIYLFRGADVSVFRSLSDDFRDGNLSMSTNYRSKPALIAVFNAIFGGSGRGDAVFYTEKDASDLLERGQKVPPYEAVYRDVALPPFYAAEAQKNCAKDTRRARLHFALYKNDENNAAPGFLTGEDAEAEWVAGKIKELVSGAGVFESNVNAPDKNVNASGCDGRENQRGKAYSYGDIAVLLRTTSTQDKFERAFLNHGIPYNTESVRGFFSDGPVNDIFAYLRMCLYPRDTMSYAQILTSPFVNLSFDEASAVLLSSKNPFDLEDSGILCKESLERFLHAKSFYVDVVKSLESLEIPEIITKLWYEGGYRYEVMWNQTVEMYAKMYDMVFAMAQKAVERNTSLSAFVDEACALKDDSKKLDGMDIPMEKISGVNILSVHKSKGLEFPVVFVCSTHKKGANDTNAAPVYFDSKYGVSVNASSGTNYFYNRMKNLNDCRENAELRRVVYVAMTRAVEELYVTNGKYSMTEDAAEKYSPLNSGKVDTMFSVMEPFFNSYIDSEEKPYDVEEILPVRRGLSSAAGKRRNTFSERLGLLREIEGGGHYRNALLVKKEFPESRYVSPSRVYGDGVQDVFSARKTASEDFRPCADFDGADSCTENHADSYTGGAERYTDISEHNGICAEHCTDSSKHYTDIAESYKADSGVKKEDVPFFEINEIVEKTSGEFGFSNFGNIAHSYMEAFVNGTQPFYSEREVYALRGSAGDIKKIEDACTRMASAFASSELGKKSRHAKLNSFCRTEFPFRSRIGSKIVKGTVDLLFQNQDGTYTVVDYKTGQTVRPELYYGQLALYREAVSLMLGEKPENVRCFLYYLRFSKSVDVSEECSNVNLESLVQGLSRNCL